jgi:integrase
MSEVHSTTSRGRRLHKFEPLAPRQRPAKPYPDFPLFPHANGTWAKKIRGKLHYFGPWEDAEAALAKYLAEKDALHAGRKPRDTSEGVTVKDVVNAFLNYKRSLVDSGELTPRMWADYKAATDVLIQHFGKSRLASDLDTEDFAGLRKRLAQRWGPVTLGNVIQRVRSVFKYAAETNLIDRPMQFGPGFARPSKKTLRLERARKGPQMFEAEELRRIVPAAGTPLKAMILLGVNCGYGNADCGTLPLSALDLERGWVTYHRPKTGINRRCPLWPETVLALQEALAKRPQPKDPADAGLVFVTKYGKRWAKVAGTLRADNTLTPPDNPVSKEMRKLLHTLGINGARNFYALRHTFETIGGEAKDQIAVDAIMGHVREDMATVYRERISDARLRAVAEHVRGWLFAPAKV